MSLKQRLLAFVMLLVMIVIAALASVAYWQMRNEIVDSVSQELSAAVRGNREALVRWMTQRRDAIEATATQLAGAADPGAFLVAGKDAGRFDQTFAGYADKRMVYHLAEKKPADGYDPTARPWYKLASEARATVTTAPYIFASTKKPGITVARAFEHAGLAGVVGGDISLEEIIGIVTSIQLRGDGYAFLATREGLIVAYGKPDSALKPVADLLPGFDANALKAESEETRLHEFVIDGRAKYVVTAPVAGTDWVLCAVIDKATILSPLNSLLSILILAGLLVTAAGVLIAHLALSRILKDLFVLRDALTDISSGQGDLTRELPVPRQDEIGQTAAAFNRFIGRLREMFVEVRENATTLDAGLDSLAGVTRTLAAESEQQAETLSSTAATIEEITVSINHIADNAQHAEQTASQTGDVSRHSAAAVGELARDIEKIASEVGQVAKTLSALGERSDAMNAIIGVIREIADQTNLLALNAAIEAARAGEMGRGFAVVADEVRKLAERTANATVDIGRLIDSTHGDIKSALADMDETQRSVEAGLSASRSVSADIDGIEHEVARVVAAVRDIAGATREQSVATNDMARAAEDVNSRTLQNDQAVQSASATVGELSALSKGLHALVGRFKL